MLLLKSYNVCLLKNREQFSKTTGDAESQMENDGRNDSKLQKLSRGTV